MSNFLGLVAGANDFEAFIPEMWANETIAILEENMVALSLVNRDFEPYFQKAGDIVNTRKPSEFVAKRKTANDPITKQDASAQNIQVKLDQHVHVSFVVNDLYQSLSMKDLVATYIQPAALALARHTDLVICGQYTRFLGNTVGSLGSGTTSNGYMLQQLANLKVKMDTQKAYPDRNLIYSPLTEGLVLGSPEFYRVNEAGSGQPRVNGFIGRNIGFNSYSAQNMADVVLNPSGTTTTVVSKGAHAAGLYAVITDGWVASTDVVVGDWVVLNGQPNRVESISGTWASNTTEMTITFKYPLTKTLADNSNIVAYKRVLVNNASGYAAGYNKSIAFDGTGYDPVVGQGVQVGSYVYTVIGRPSATEMVLDRSLEESVADNATIQPLPNGSYSLAFNKNAITVAVRPLAPVPAGMGAKSGFASYNGLTVRATMGYDMDYQNTIVTLDFLMGIQVLEVNQGAVLLA